jgi:hypothetical protein
VIELSEFRGSENPVRAKRILSGASFAMDFSSKQLIDQHNTTTTTVQPINTKILPPYPFIVHT